MIKRLCVYYFKKSGWRFLGNIPKKERSAILVYGPQASWRELVLAIAVKTLTHFNVKIFVESKAWNWKSRWLLKVADARSFDPKSETADATLLDHSSTPRCAWAFPLNPVNQPFAAKYDHFYSLALKHKSTVVLVAFDIRRKVIKFHSPFHFSGYRSRDLHYVEGFFNAYYKVVPNQQ